MTRKDCSIKVATKSLTRLPPHTICGARKVSDIDIVQDYGFQLTPKVINKLKSHLCKENTWIVFAVGFHYQLNFKRVKERYLDKFWAIKSESGCSWPQLVWMGLHTLDGFLRQTTLPHNQKIRKYNGDIAEYWATKNVTVVDTASMSDGINSYDGRHYGVGFNMLKVNLLLGILKRYYDENENELSLEN